jgi:peptidoglycan/xylan/chitin deacetylase (PgdA/CDA1 family)
VNRGLLGLAFAAALGLFGYGLYRFSLHAGEQPIPAIVTRSDDPHRTVSAALDARISRALARERAPEVARGNAKLVALTFDDGPYPLETPLLLDELSDLHVHATFFLIGNDALEYPLLAERIGREGHEIANHTLTHPEHFEDLDAADVTAELTGGARVLERYSSDPAIRTMMRPPHGRYSEDTVRAAQRAGYQMILWNDDPGDWHRSVRPAQLAQHLENDASAPDIILLHSGRMSTIEMLPQVVDRFRKAGFTFVTVGQLMQRLPVPVINSPTKMPV